MNRKNNKKKPEKHYIEMQPVIKHLKGHAQFRHRDLAFDNNSLYDPLFDGSYKEPSVLENKDRNLTFDNDSPDNTRIVGGYKETPLIEICDEPKEELISNNVLQGNNVRQPSLSNKDVDDNKLGSYIPFDDGQQEIRHIRYETIHNEQQPKWRKCINGCGLCLKNIGKKICKFFGC